MTGSQELFQQAMNRGHSAAWDQLWDKAAVFYRQALEELPDHPQALTNLGLALYELQNYDEALDIYQRAAKVLPNDPLPMEKVAQLYERIGNLEQAYKASLQAAELYLKNRDVNKAIENWLRVGRLNPENLQAHTRLALVYERIGEKPKAVSEYLAVASLLQAAGDLERAVRSVNQALQIMPNSDEAIQALVMLKDFKQLPKPARPRGGTAPLRMAQVRQLEAPKAAAQVENNLDPIGQARQKALTVLAGMLFDTADEGLEDIPRRGLQTMLRNTSSLAAPSRPMDRGRVMLHLSQVVDLQTRGDNEQAASELEKAIDAGLENQAAYFDYGFLLAQTGHSQAAQEALKQAFHHPDFALGAHLLMADLLSKENQLRPEAVEYLEALKLADASVVDPEQAGDLRQLYDPLVEAFRQENDAEAQARLCENVNDLLMRPDWRDNLVRARGQLPARGGSVPVPLAEIIIQARSSGVIDSLTKIYDLSNNGHLRSAMEEAFYTLQFAPTYLPLHTFMADLLLKQGQLQDAIAKYLVLARAYSVRGEVPRAIELYRRILQLAPMDMNTRTRLIEQLASADRTEDAIQEYMELAEVYYNMADLVMVRKTYTEALRLAQQSKVDRAWRVKILHRMADIDLQSLDWRQALRIFEQIRTLQPEDETARTSLVELNFRLGQESLAVAELDNYMAYLASSGQKEKAMAFLESLVAENPKRLLVRRRLAELYRQLGRTADAVNQLDAVGEALMEAGDRTSAVQVIETIIALNPPNREEYQRLLGQVRSR